MAAKRIWICAVLVALSACRPAAVGGPELGASSPAAAAQQFLSAARAEDLQAMSAVWGNSEAPVRDQVERQELERRLIIMVCHLRHDESTFGTNEAGEQGRQLVPITLKSGTLTATSKFTMVKNQRSGRWFVENFEMEPLRPLCTRPPSRPPQ